MASLRSLVENHIDDIYLDVDIDRWVIFYRNRRCWECFAFSPAIDGLDYCLSAIDEISAIDACAAVFRGFHIKEGSTIKRRRDDAYFREFAADVLRRYGDSNALATLYEDLVYWYGGTGPEEPPQEEDETMSKTTDQQILYMHCITAATLDELAKLQNKGFNEDHPEVTAVCAKLDMLYTLSHALYGLNPDEFMMRARKLNAIDLNFG